MNVADLPDGPPRDYLELVERYRNGGFTNAARELARWSRESAEVATEYFETRVSSDRERISAALLHTDVVLRSVADEDFHLETAEHLLAGIQDVALRGKVQRQWNILMGEHLRYQIRDGEAVSLLEPALELFPDDGELMMLYGTVCEAAGWMRKDDDGPWIDAAEKLYRRLLKANPDHAEAHLRLGHIYRLRKRLDDATEELQSSLSPDNTPEIEAVARLLLGDIHRERRETAKAIESYRAALALESRFKTAATALSYSLFEAGELDEARDVVQRFYAVEESPTDDHDLWWRYLRGHRGSLVARMTLMRTELQ
jgi:tetratricopeptide (TPR) repeat protein